MNSTNNTAMQPEQAAQEEEYDFPYHFVSRFFPTFQTGFIDPWAMNYNLSLELVLNLIGQESPESIVDIGCGDGRLTFELGKAFPDSRIVGIDYSQRAISLAKSMVPDSRFETIDISNEHSLGQFQAAVLMEVFEHIQPDKAEQFAQGTAHLVPEKGLLIVTVPHENKPLEYKHFQHFTVDTLDPYFRPYFSRENVIFLEKLNLLNRFLHWLVVNRFFVLNSPRLLRTVYRIYRKNVFQCPTEKQCARFAVCYRRRSRATG